MDQLSPSAAPRRCRPIPSGRRSVAHTPSSVR
jgi:hypothetical protein